MEFYTNYDEYFKRIDQFLFFVTKEGINRQKKPPKMAGEQSQMHYTKVDVTDSISGFTLPALRC